MSMLGLSLLAVYEYLRSKGLNLPDSRNLVSMVPIALLTGTEDEEDEDGALPHSAASIMGEEGKEEFNEQVRKLKGKKQSDFIDANTRELESDPEANRKMRENLKAFLGDNDE